MADGDHSGISAIQHRADNPIEHLSNADVQAIAGALSAAGESAMAIWRLAIDAHQADDDGWYLVAIKELARATVRRLDASLCRLVGGEGMGNFATEFDRE